MVKLQTTMNSYVKWLTHRDSLVGEKGVPASVLGRTMIAHGEDFDRDSQFGNCLIEMGRANDQVAQIQEQYAQDATRHWSDSVERSVAMMKEYQVRKKKSEPNAASIVVLSFSKSIMLTSLSLPRPPAKSSNPAVSPSTPLPPK